MPPENENPARRIPSIDALLQDAELREATASVPRAVVVSAVRGAAEEVRNAILEGGAEYADEPAIRAAILERVCDRVRTATSPHFCKAINATGIILHTGLGRAVLAPRALRQIQDELSGYSVVQLDTETGKRSRRDGRIEWLLQQLAGAEAATVVNNNAAATLIVLNTVAAGKEVIVSRGQLVEIGGSFRLPEVMAASGARLVEVGTTNRTHPRDYENAVTEHTAAIMRVHPSNYVISGFTAEVSLEELEKIAHAHGLVLIDDVGAGALVDLSRFGFRREPTLPESVRAGADLVTCSADKLIGASQAGLILGKAALVNAVRKNPLARAVRVGKLTLAALEATLMLFLDEPTALDEVPTLRMLRRELSDIAAQAERIAHSVRQQVADRIGRVETIDGFSQMGSGSLPEQDLPTRLVALSSRTISADQMALRLREQTPPVFARIEENRVLIDPRTLLEGEEGILVVAIIEAFSPEK